MASRPDLSAQTALEASVLRPVFLGWLDINTDPLRATTAGRDLALTGTGDPDLDGYTFSAIDPQFVTVSDVQFGEGGTETVTATLSGLIGPDSDLLNLIGNTANWRGREARLWQGVELENGTVVVWAYYTGRMMALDILAAPTEQTIQVSIESYLAVLAPASNRTYADQSYFDPADLSNVATMASANGFGGAGVNVSNGGGGGGGGNFYPDFRELPQ